MTAAKPAAMTVIGILSVSVPGAETVTKPVFVPAGRLAGFTATETVLESEVEPVCGPAASQAPESVETE